MDYALGERIKYFRNRADMSQLELEVETGLAAGSVSRLENGKVNPSKETLQHLAVALDLNQDEKMTLFGIGLEQLTGEEINRVQKQLSDYFAKPTTIALLLDNQWRMIEASRGMRNMFPFSDDEVQQVLIGKNLLELIFDPKLGIRQFLDNLEELDRIELSYFKTVMRLRSDESWYKDLVNKLGGFEYFKRAWNESEELGYLPYPARTRIVKFKFGEKKVTLVSNFTHYNPDPRFEIIDYVPISIK